MDDSVESLPASLVHLITDCSGRRSTVGRRPPAARADEGSALSWVPGGAACGRTIIGDSIGGPTERRAGVHRQCGRRFDWSARVAQIPGETARLSPPATRRPAPSTAPHQPVRRAAGAGDLPSPSIPPHPGHWHRHHHHHHRMGNSHAGPGGRTAPAAVAVPRAAMRLWRYRRADINRGSTSSPPSATIRGELA